MSALAKMIKRLMAQAKHNPNISQCTTLSNGLRIAIKCTGGKYRVGLSRPKVYPSTLEAGVVESYLQAGAKLEWQQEKTKDGAHWLWAEVAQ